MTTEVAIFTALPGKEEELGQAILRGLDVIRQHPGLVSARVERCIEKPGQYMLINIWTSLEAHVNDFRSGPLYPQWRRHITGLFEENPVVFHYEPF
jgi:quinol monooxygenase YgiN